MATSAILVCQTLCPLPGEGNDSRYKAAEKKNSFLMCRQVDVAAKAAQQVELSLSPLTSTVRHKCKLPRAEKRKETSRSGRQRAKLNNVVLAGIDGDMAGST
jgi:hypothetical protein